MCRREKGKGTGIQSWAHHVYYNDSLFNICIWFFWKDILVWLGEKGVRFSEFFYNNARLMGSSLIVKRGVSFDGIH